MRACSCRPRCWVGQSRFSTSTRPRNTREWNAPGRPGSGRRRSKTFPRHHPAHLDWIASIASRCLSGSTRGGSKNALQQSRELLALDGATHRSVVEVDNDDAPLGRNDDVLPEMAAGRECAMTDVGSELNGRLRHPPQVAVADARPDVGV